MTVESEAVLAKHQRDHGGTLTRIAISRAERLSAPRRKGAAPDGWRALAPITQLCAVKG